MRLFQAALDTPLDSPFSATLSVHGLHFTVCAPSNLDGHLVEHLDVKFIMVMVPFFSSERPSSTEMAI